jgi:hypothetical protein
MARIRTIKPEFFTSEDIVSLSPLARLLYQATWCEADKEGRLQWKPGTFKLRYFPADNCDIYALAAELVDRGLVVLYGDGLAYIPQFARHQHINPRESDSQLPDPHAKAQKSTRQPRVNTRHDASARDDDAQGGRERKGKEGKGKEEPPPTPQGGQAGDVIPTPGALVCKALKAAGMADVNPSHPMLTMLLEAGATEGEFIAAAAKAEGKANGFAYVLACVKGDRERAKSAAGEVHRGPLRVVNRQMQVEAENKRVAAEWLKQQERANAAT